MSQEDFDIYVERVGILSDLERACPKLEQLLASDDGEETVEVEVNGHRYSTRLYGGVQHFVPTQVLYKLLLEEQPFVSAQVKLLEAVSKGDVALEEVLAFYPQVGFPVLLLRRLLTNLLLDFPQEERGELLAFLNPLEGQELSPLPEEELPSEEEEEEEEDPVVEPFNGKEGLLEHSKQVLARNHTFGQCSGKTCPLHKRTAHFARSWPQKYTVEAGYTKRVCKHGFDHPDPDDTWAPRHHYCDGCCPPEAR